MNAVLSDVAPALPPFVVGIFLTWRLIWPRWKVYGKGVAYGVGVAVLSSVEDPDRYIALSKAWVGVKEEASSAPD
jgi:hypothetical protein